MFVEQKKLLQLVGVLVVVSSFASEVQCVRSEVTQVIVRSNLEHRYAVTHVTAYVKNLRAHEALLTFKTTLPKAVYVSSLKMEVGGRNYSTTVTEREGPRRRHPNTSEENEERGRSKSSLRKDTTQNFKASVKADALDTAIFYLTYEELLQRVRGRYNHRIYFPRGNISTIEVEVKFLESEAINELQITQIPGRQGNNTSFQDLVEQESSTPGEIHLRYREENVVTVPLPRDTNTDNDGDEDIKINNLFSLKYDVERQPDGGEIQVLGGFFVHYFCPEGLPKLPTHTVFVLDVSGSMHEEGKLSQLKLAMEAILRDLQSDDSFEILVFSTMVTSMGSFSAAPRDIERSVAKINRLQAMGGTNFNDALLQAILDVNSFNKTLTAKQVVFLTDGRPNIGEIRSDQLRQNIRNANIHQHPIFSLGLGNDADMRLLRQVSTDNYGFTRKIYQEKGPAEQLKGFYQEISTPLMTDVDVIYLEDEVDNNSIVKRGTSTYFSGDEMIVAGHLQEGVTQLQPIVKGRGQEGPVQFRVSRVRTTDTVPHGDNLVERLWAYLTVQDLLAMQELVEDRNLRVEMRARALEIALRFQFVTKLTTLEISQHEDLFDGDSNGYKSASRHQKSNLGLPGAGHTVFNDRIAIVSPSEFAKTLPAQLSTRVHTSSPASRISFGENDPHFVVQVSGIEMPLCFDVHGQHNDIFSLVRDHKSGIMVNGEVTEATSRAGATYFTKIFIGLGTLNLTITPFSITVDCLDDQTGLPTVDAVSTTIWPFRKRHRHGKRRPRTRASRRRRKPHGKQKPAKSLRREVATTANGGHHVHVGIGQELQNSEEVQHSHEQRRRGLQRSHKLSWRRRTRRHVFTQRSHRQPLESHPATDQRDTPSQILKSHSKSRRRKARPRKMVSNHKGANRVKRNHSYRPLFRNRVHPHSNRLQSLHPHERVHIPGNRTIKYHSKTRSDAGILRSPHFLSRMERDSRTSPMANFRNPLNMGRYHPHFRVFGQPQPNSDNSHPLSILPTAIHHPQAKEYQLHSGNHAEDHSMEPVHSLQPEIHDDTQNTTDNSTLRSQNTIQRKPSHNMQQGNNKNTTQTTLDSTPQTTNSSKSKTNEVESQVGQQIHAQANVQMKDEQTNSMAETQSVTPTVRADPSQTSSVLSRTEAHSGDRREELKQACEETLSWKEAAGRRYGNVVMSLRNHRKLDLLLGDVDVHFFVTRSKNKHGQRFLGFYIEGQRILSPNTTGIIGQFAYKTVGKVASEELLAESDSVRLAVVQAGPYLRHEVTQVDAIVSRRRSLLHKTHVPCLYVPHQGRGLLAGDPHHYLLPCLTC